METHQAFSAPTHTAFDPAATAYQQWRSARERLQPVLDWYDRVYRRLSNRIEEDQILTEAGLVLLATPAVIFYPIVRWNVRTVLWDGADPDAATDPVTAYCTERLAREEGRTAS
jgi:hypothetical protein